MIDFKFEEIACWVPQAVEPIEFENWVGNKLLGVKVVENKEWEKAFIKWELGNGIGEAKGADDKETLELILDGKRPEGIVPVEGIGTLICPVGKMGEAEIRMDKEKTTVLGDEILILPLPLGETKKIKVNFKRDLRIASKNSLEVEVTGGRMGLVVDTRGRPLVLPTVDNAGRERLLKWQKARI